MKLMDKMLMLIQFFTRIPVNRSFDYSERNFKRASCFLTSVGIITGLVTSIVALIISVLGIKNSEIAAVLILIFYIMLNGAFHLDGLSDTTDGIFSGRNKERILEIMKDSRIGSYGTISMILAILSKFIIFKSFTAVSMLDRFSILLFVIIPIAGKYAISFGGFKARRAKEISSGNYFINNSDLTSLCINAATFFISCFICIFIMTSSLYLSFSYALVSIFCITLFAYLLRVLITGKIGGLLGDNLGFIAELNEILMGFMLILLFRL